MANKFRNEMEIKVGGETILLRPTFENVAAMEANVGAVAWLAWKYSRGAAGKDAAKAIPPLTELAKIIYYNQAATNPEDSTQKKLSLEQIWDLVLVEGAATMKDIMLFLVRITTGDKDAEGASETEKKE